MLELRRDLSTCPLLGLVSPPEQLCFCFSGDFISYLSYRGKGICPWGRDLEKEVYLLFLQTFSQFPYFWLLPHLYFLGFLLPSISGIFLALSRVDQLASCYRHSGTLVGPPLSLLNHLPFFQLHILCSYRYQQMSSGFMEDEIYIIFFCFPCCLAGIILKRRKVKRGLYSFILKPNIPTIMLQMFI